MKKKLSVSVFTCLMFVGLVFSSAVSAAIPPHQEHPGYGGGGGKPPPCTTYPCPIAP